MTTLSKRATLRQARVLRMIEGAVKNALDAHPDYATMPRDKLARSIAKRAAGTLTAAWPDVLAPGRSVSETPQGLALETRGDLLGSVG